MTAWLDPIRRALDQRLTPCAIFFRDDDAGWDDDALTLLLDQFDQTGVAIDVAAIPAAVTVKCGRQLRARMNDGLVRVHQHGFAHTNHETAGRSSEFGSTRSVDAQVADIVAGRTRLDDIVGGIDPIFTPPWNRCVAATADAVVAAGHRVLSRDLSAGSINAAGVAEVPVTIDWFARCKGVRITPAQLGEQIAAGMRGDDPVGVMLHHAVMDNTERTALRQLLNLVARSPGATPVRILSVASAEGL